MIRKPIITVLGHVDAGKTKFLDAIRGTLIAEKEAGGITQHIGATEVPIEAIKNLSGGLIEKYNFDIKIPGLLFIDTPGHEAFTNLRKRGGSIADLAVLVVDIQKGLQNQTIEAIEILKSYKTPFIVVANKVDTIHGWNVVGGSISESMNHQSQDALETLDTKIYELVGQLFEKGFRAERFDRVKEMTKEIYIVPISAKQKEGLPEVLMLLAGLSQKFLEKRLSIHVQGDAKGTVLEVKEEKGLGKTIDVILYDGSLKVGEEIVLAGKNGIIKTKIRALLEPRPLDEMRSPQERFRNVSEVHAAAGVKIAAPGLDDALAGSPVLVEGSGSEREVLEEIQRVKIDTQEIGPIIRSDTLGSLEAFIKLLEDRGIKVRKADIGEVSRRDIIEADAIREKDEYMGIVFAFHTKVDEAAEKEASLRNVRIFRNDVVYRLIEEYSQWVDAEKNKERLDKLAKVTFPAQIRIIPGYVFRNSKPAIVGIEVEEGRLKNNVSLMGKNGIVGKVQAIQSDGKSMEEAKKGQEVAVSIEGAVAGKDFMESDTLYTHIPKRQIQMLKEVIDTLSSGEVELLHKIEKMEEAASQHDS